MKNVNYREIDTCKYFNEETGCNQSDCICEIQKPKQETLEFVAILIEKIQREEREQEISYSEEEVLVILHKRDMYEWEEENEILSVTDWFEQFKKK